MKALTFLFKNLYIHIEFHYFFHSSQCYCGDKHPSPNVKADEGDCETRCTGDSSKVCGGNLRLSIYSTSITSLVIFITYYTYKICFNTSWKAC